MSGRWEGPEDECPKCHTKGKIYSWLDSICYDEEEGVELRNCSYECKKCKHKWEDYE